MLAEIHRVLRVGGAVYTEVPFMQQVHEGAYDFTRFTLSGHRWLARSFREISAGPVAGPGTALAWAIEHFALAAIGSERPVIRNATKGVVRWLFWWLRLLDRVLLRSSAGIDGAACTDFLGRKEDGYELTGRDLISAYEMPTSA